MRNKEVANVLNEIAELLELIEELPFKPRAYRRAARSIEGLTEDLADLAARDELEDIPGVGKAISKKIQELLETGTLQYLEELRKEFSNEFLELIRIPRIGPKTAKKLKEELGVESIDQLRAAIDAHQIRQLPGFGQKSEEALQLSLAQYDQFSQRMFIGLAYSIAQDLFAQLKQLPNIQQVEIAGSLRRWKETVGDIDILITSENPIPIMTAVARFPEVERVLVQGPTKTSVVLKKGIQVDFRVIEPNSFGAALQYFTGSKAHNIALRRLAQQRGWKLSEYGLFDVKTDEKIAGQTEEDIYNSIGIPWIPPELREDTGEIQAALQNSLPNLICLDDIRGDFQIHTTWSDGRNTIEEMVQAARKRNYEYIAITDHSKTDRIAGGMPEDRFLNQIQKIREINKKFKDIHVLASIEVEILSDGSLDYSDEILSQTDVVVAGLHYGMKGSEDEITKRLVKAMENPYVDILVHPTGRIINKRLPYKVNVDRIIEAAKQNQVHIEINSSQRLDFSDSHARLAKEKGVKLVINTDAHQIDQLDLMQFGVATARRGWLEAKDVINTRPFSDLKKLLKHVQI
jgi:DNA polymerase (family 10)